MVGVTGERGGEERGGRKKERDIKVEGRLFRKRKRIGGLVGVDRCQKRGGWV